MQKIIFYYISYSFPSLEKHQQKNTLRFKKAWGVFFANPACQQPIFVWTKNKDHTCSVGLPPTKQATTR